MSNTLAVLTTIIGLAINGAGLVFVATQVVLARRQLRDNLVLSSRETLRVKRQATVDFYMATMQKVGEWRSALPDDWDTRKIDVYVHSAYRLGGKGRRLTLANYLAYFETLAVAIRAGIYDLAVFDSIAGSRIINICDNYHKFFLARRREVGSDLAYINLEWLAAELRGLRASPDYAHSPLPTSAHALTGHEYQRAHRYQHRLPRKLLPPRRAHQGRPGRAPS